MIDQIKTSNNYVYLIILREFILLNSPVYKIGRTNQDPPTNRIYAYPKGSCLEWLTHVENGLKTEAKIKKELIATPQIRHRTDLGQEYFEGDINLIKSVFISCCFESYVPNQVINNISSSKNNSINETIQPDSRPDSQPDPQNDYTLRPVKFGRPNMNYICKKLGKDIVGQIIMGEACESIAKLFREIHVNRKLPEYQNIYMINEKSELVKCYNGKKFDNDYKKLIISEIIENFKNILYNYIQDNENKLPEEIIDDHFNYRKQLIFLERKKYFRKLEAQITDALLDAKDMIAARLYRIKKLQFKSTYNLIDESMDESTDDSWDDPINELFTELNSDENS